MRRSRNYGCQPLMATGGTPSPSRVIQKTLPWQFGKKQASAISQEVFDQRIQEFVIESMSPLSIVENVKFKNLFLDLTPGLQVLSRRSLGRRLEQTSSCVREKITAMIAKQDFVCTTADIWSTKHRSFMGVTVHWLDETWERKSATLACRRFSGIHSYDRIAELLDDIRREYSIPESKIVATVTDNGANFVKAFKEFGIEYRTISDEFNEESIAEECMENAIIDVDIRDGHDADIILPRHMRCASHTLSLVCTTDAKKGITGQMSKIHHATMAKCSALWNAAGKPKAAEKIYSALECRLLNPCPTRWNSLYDSVVLLLNKKHRLNQVMTLLNLPSFKESELEYLTEYVTVAKPVALALDKLQGDKSCHYGCLLPTLLATKKKLERLAVQHLRYAQPLVKALLDGFSHRFKMFLLLETDIYFNHAIIASLSHPQFKNKWLTISERTNTEEYRKQTQDMFISVTKEESNVGNLEEQLQTTGQASDSGSCDDFFEYGKESSISDSKKEKNCVIEMEILQFFSDERKNLQMLAHYPNIARVFKKFNTPLPSSAPVERLFSYAGHIHAAKRGNLSDGLFEKLVVLKGNSAFI